MKKESSLFAIYKYDFHKAQEPTIHTVEAGANGDLNVKHAQTCFASLFDQNHIDNLAKMNKKGEYKRLQNDVMGKGSGIVYWRVNNSLIKDLWMQSGKDSMGVNKYSITEFESTPPCNVLIDNRPGVCLMAIEKSMAWGSNPDLLRDLLLNNFNRLLINKFGIEMRIEARMNPTDIWEFMHERIYEHGDFIRRVAFSFQNPKKINKTSSSEIKSARLKAMLRTVEIADALKGFFMMEFDQNTKNKFSKKNKDMAEMVRLCGENGYDISITFNDYKVYRINDYVKAFYQMDISAMEDFRLKAHTINGKTELEEWFDLVAEQTKGYVNESEVSKRRNKAHK